MEDTRAQCRELKEGWVSVYNTIKASPTVYSAHLPYSSPDQINEIVSTISHWLDRVKAPTGFAPAFHLAKGLFGTSLANTLISLKGLQKEEYNHFPSFVAGLNQILSSLHSMVVFSMRPEVGEALADLGASLSQGIALVDTAQRELKEKLNLLEQSEQVAQKTMASSQLIEQIKPKAEGILESINVIQKSAEETLAEINSCEEESKQSEETIKTVLKKNTELQSTLDAQGKALEELNKKSQSQQKLISDLLPKGASAGLASAFGARVGQLEKTKWIWMTIFILSIGWLAWTAYMDTPVGPTEEIWKHLLHRLPLAAPSIWLGWFSAIQYGNTVRVQEDYAFKEATSKAFAGYKDHMDHMANVSLNEANTAMTLLAEKTINILSHEPLRIFQKSERDASPTPTFMDFLRGKGKSEEKPGSSK